MPLRWTDTEAVAAELRAAHPEAAPLSLSPDQLRAWAAALPGLETAWAADDGTLHAVQMLWYELAQAEEQDVSG